MLYSLADLGEPDDLEDDLEPEPPEPKIVPVQLQAKKTKPPKVWHHMFLTWYVWGTPWVRCGNTSILLVDIRERS